MALRCNNRMLLVVLFLPLLASCSNTVKHKQTVIYPSSWSEPLFVSGRECPAINGVFQNLGKTSDEGANYPITLDGAIFGMPPTSGAAEKVLLNYIPGSRELQIQLYSGPVDEAHSLSTFGRSVNCENGWLVMDQSGTGYADGTYSESTSTISMAISESGDFILRSVFHVKRRSLGVFTSSKKGIVWYLFAQDR